MCFNILLKRATKLAESGILIKLMWYQMVKT